MSDATYGMSPEDYCRYLAGIGAPGVSERFEAQRRRIAELEGALVAEQEHVARLQEQLAQANERTAEVAADHVKTQETLFACASDLGTAREQLAKAKAERDDWKALATLGKEVIDENHHSK